MNKLTKFILVGLVLVFAVALTIPVAAQEQDVPGPGEGDAIIWSNFGADINTMNPFLSADGTSNTIITLIFPDFVTYDPDTGQYAPDAKNSIVADWTISDDGTTYTFTLDDDWTWSDGTPITAADIEYAWEVINDESVNNNSNLIQIRDNVESMEFPDERTVVVTFTTAACNAIDIVSVMPVVPAHAYRELYPVNADMNDSDENLNPQVTGDTFQFLNYRPGEQVTLIANPDFPDADLGAVIPEGFIFKNVADQNVGVEQFLAGQLSRVGAPQSRQQEIQDLVDAGEYQGHNYAGGNVRFLAFNLGDPENPVDGLDEDGNVLDQGLHPIFGDVRVRQALNYAIEFEAINQGTFFGFGFQGATHSRPDNWAHPEDIEPYPFDLEQADALLTEAGWIDNDGDGVRECTGCLYATEVDPEFEGSPMEFELLTNAGNVSQEALGTVLQDQWGDVGAVVDFAPIDFNVLVDTLVGQTFDAIMIFWGFGFPSDPDGITVTFDPSNDIVGSGFNAGSYYNPRVTELLDEARSLPGCDVEERKAMYGEIYQILHDESPWIWIGFSNILIAAQPNIENWDPRPTTNQSSFWNTDSWIIESP